MRAGAVLDGAPPIQGLRELFVTEMNQSRRSWIECDGSGRFGPVANDRYLASALLPFAGTISLLASPTCE